MLGLRTRRFLCTATLGTLLTKIAVSAKAASADGISSGFDLKEMPKGWALPPVTFFDSEQHSKSISDFAGYGIVLNVWATWCAPCVKEFHTLDYLSKAVASERIIVLPVASDLNGPAFIKAFYQKHGIESLPIFTGGTGISQAWHVDEIPLTVLFNRSGQPRAWLEGEADWSTQTALNSVRRLCA